MNLFLVVSEQPQTCWRLMAEGFEGRQLQRLTQALEAGPVQSRPLPKTEGRNVFEFVDRADEEAIVMHALAVARKLKARLCLRGVPALT
jgi:hypothetical protein